jgi:hypothetical protein
MVSAFEFFVSVCVGALIFVLAHTSFHVVFAEFCLVLGAFALVFLVSELALISFLAFILQEVSADSFPLESEEFIDLILPADVDPGAWGFHGEDGGDGALKFSGKVVLGPFHDIKFI